MPFCPALWQVKHRFDYISYPVPLYMNFSFTYIQCLLFGKLLHVTLKKYYSVIFAYSNLITFSKSAGFIST